MTSEVSICNLALSNVGKGTITALTEASTEAQYCNQFYEHTRDMLLQSYPWRFARSTVALASITNTRSNRWLYAYKRPNDCLKIRRVTGELFLDYLPYENGPVVAGGHAYDVEGSTLFCDLSPAYLDYTKIITDPTVFPPLFVDALSWHLATRLAMPITRDPKVRANAFQLAQQMQNAASVADANEVRETSDYPAEMNEARDPYCFPARPLTDG